MNAIPGSHFGNAVLAKEKTYHTREQNMLCSSHCIHGLVIAAETAPTFSALEL